MALGEAQDLVAPYKEGLIKKWGIKKFNLDDLYVRFFRLAERRIAEKGGRGVVCYISNSSYVREPSFVVMREHLANSFDKVWIDNLNGDSRETGKTTPEGLPDPSVFSTPYNKEGIRKGTAVALLVKGGTATPLTRHPREGGEPVTPSQSTTGAALDSRLRGNDEPPAARVLYREWWGAAKREDLLASLDEQQRDKQYDVASPAISNRHSLRPTGVSSAYSTWFTLPELAAQAPCNGLMEKRGGALIDIEKDVLKAVMLKYFDPITELSNVLASRPEFGQAAAGYDPAATREKLRKNDVFQETNLVRYAARPFDTRWAYYSSVNPLWNRPRPALWEQFKSGNRFLISRVRTTSSGEGHPISFTRCLLDDHYVMPDATAIPLGLTQQKSDDAQDDWFANTQANLSEFSRKYLSNLGLLNPDTDSYTAELIWMHALAIGYSPAYLSENADGIRENWPRIPLPASKAALLTSAALGREVAALLDTEATVPGVTSGTIRDELKPIAVVSRVGGGALQAAEFALTAGWGSGGKDGKDGKNAITMPGKGKTEPRHAETSEQAAGFGSAPTLDIYLNAKAYWKNIPQPVYDFTIGGYQVIKKWLSYREQRVLGRALTMAEIMEVTAMARRIGALVLLQSKLDENYRAASSDTWGNP